MKTTIKWDEQALQNAVYIHCAIKNHELIVPNSNVFAWESDVVSVTKTGFIHEFEIKISRSDFKADAKKERAKALVNPAGIVPWRPYKRPNYFYYVVPSGLISPEEVPDYAGLVYVPKIVEGHHLYYGVTETIKQPKRLHKEKIAERQRRQLERAITYRFWKQRLNRKG